MSAHTLARTALFLAAAIAALYALVLVEVHDVDWRRQTDGTSMPMARAAAQSAPARTGLAAVAEVR